MKFQIMLSCAGRQAPLVDAFRTAATEVGRVIVADLDPYAAASSVGDLFLKSPPYTEAMYQHWCLDVCERHNIGLWISLKEEELLVLEEIRPDLASRGCVLVGAPVLSIELAQDKLGYADALKPYGLLTLPSQTLKEVTEDLQLTGESFIIKKRRGRGSHGLKHASSRQELIRLAENEMVSANWIVQPFLEGNIYCIDVINDLSGCYAGCLCRKRLKMGIQETDVALTLNDPDIESIAEKLSLALRHQGCMDVDLIKHEGRVYVLDINLRFGGSHIFSLEAGARVPQAIIAWRQGKQPDPAYLDHIPGLIISRFSSVCRVGRQA
ncbi:ATP-grasp domain-containing protein [Ectothiorhodospira variabilis]|uniref:ATP-grasp domain-containing protein n=1 Tax=Ectothiorhodospira variabilis TaxID=505694 RepID=UPI001EFB7645|nr:ATP-grasp domain-containing protein [Ectothiorhodospira variabilis]MCG5495989.1 ATP-grasp domain-containing protein [Ectothiorhodospira variabilis]MCG5505344.1 ATP-grasp domain-containing protein [Ectothiorhodospira variabilis]MCG5508530.1 ATP-grasp domain-containing protein [Ectothiorhodospira variabilis]